MGNQLRQRETMECGTAGTGKLPGIVKQIRYQGHRRASVNGDAIDLNKKVALPGLLGYTLVPYMQSCFLEVMR